MPDSSPPKTAIVDPRVPLGKVYVDLTVEEVLDACRQYINNKKFDDALDAVYDGEIYDTMLAEYLLFRGHKEM